jgi:hypothetical protein
MRESVISQNLNHMRHEALLFSAFACIVVSSFGLAETTKTEAHYSSVDVHIPRLKITYFT